MTKMVSDSRLLIICFSEQTMKSVTFGREVEILKPTMRKTMTSNVGR